MAQLLLELFPFGDITRDPLHADGHTILIDELGIGLDGYAMSVLGDDFHFIGRHPLPGKFAPQHFARVRQVLRRYGLREIQFKSFRYGITGDHLPGFVHRGVITFHVVGVNDVVGVLYQITITFFALT